MTYLRSVWLRVVSMPCMDIFEQQSVAYKLSVFPRGAPVMSIEPASTDSWRRYAHAPFGTRSCNCLASPVLHGLNVGNPAVPN